MLQSKPQKRRGRGNEAANFLAIFLVICACQFPRISLIVTGNVGVRATPES